MLQELKALADAIVAFIKSPRWIVTAAGVCAAMLFLPKEWLSKVGVADLAIEFRQWWGVAFLGTGLYVAVLVGEWLWGILVSKRKAKAERQAEEKKNADVDRKRQELIDGLTHEELQHLRPFLVDDRASVCFDHTDGVAARLRAARILQVHVSSFDILEGPAHSITPWAKTALSPRLDEIAALPAYKRPRRI
jgi:hypothetical protein